MNQLLILFRHPRQRGQLARRVRRGLQYLRPLPPEARSVPPLLRARLGIRPPVSDRLRRIGDRFVIAALCGGFLLVVWMWRDLPALLGS